ncbi:MAG: transporter ATP-binding protein [Subtercola sp.]|nr:transporter ATP-binding protein [Subtercola sp.]
MSGATGAGGGAMGSAGGPEETAAPLLDVRELTIRFGRSAPVVDGISFEIAPGECLGLVGESGSGKSVTSRALLGLVGAGSHVEAALMAFASPAEPRIRAGEDHHDRPEPAARPGGSASHAAELRVSASDTEDNPHETESGADRGRGSGSGGAGLAGDARPSTSGSAGSSGTSVLDLRGLGARAWRQVRGGQIGYVPQAALVGLDPLRAVGREIDDVLRLHSRLTPAERRAHVRELLATAGVPEPELRAVQRPFELSGGLRQRALIAAAIAGSPSLLIADEPTTALDATVQAGILTLLERLRDSGTAILLISHDLAVVSRLANRVAVLRNGRIVETGPTRQILDAPQHPYTRELVAAVPTSRPRGSLLAGSATPAQSSSPAPTPALMLPDRAATSGRSQPPTRATTRSSTTTRAPGSDREPGSSESAAPVPAATRSSMPGSGDLGGRNAMPGEGTEGGAGTGTGTGTSTTVLEATGLGKWFGARAAVDGVSFTLERGRTLGLVGESGSGKTTVARLVLALTEPDEGEVRLLGEPWSTLHERERRPLRPRIGAIYQDALSSFDPRLTVGQILSDAKSAGRSSRTDVADLLERVGLAASVAAQRPRFLSGGQQQRVAIARALAPRPDILICDEPVSSLDVSVQARILDLLDALQHDLGVAYLFITHDLGVARHMSDDLLVMRDGHVVESGPTEAVFAAPKEEYTRQLLAAAPRLGAYSPVPRSRLQ